MGEEPYTHHAMKNYGLHADRVLLLPLRSFGSKSYGGGDDVFISHQFAGTWKAKTHRRFFDEGGPKNGGKDGGKDAAHTKPSVHTVAGPVAHKATASECDDDKKKLCSDVKPGRKLSPKSSEAYTP
jgi:hypothetical protein